MSFEVTYNGDMQYIKVFYSTEKKIASRVELFLEKDGTKKRRLKKTGEIID